MIWKHFPVGMSFSVADFSAETKKRCWNIALRALAATTVENRRGMELYDNCAKNIPGSADLEYVCIFDHQSVKQSRVNVALWRSMDRLLANLSLHMPFYQANALDGFGPYVALGSIAEDGTLQRKEEGAELLPNALPDPIPIARNGSVLIALPAEQDAFGYAHALKEIGKAAAEAEKEVIYCPMANGSAGSTYAITVAMRGRFEWVETLNTAGETQRILLGVIPGSTAVADLSCLLKGMETTVSPSEAFGTLVRKILNLGYRSMIFSWDGYRETDAGEGFDRALCTKDDPQKPDPRLADSTFRILTSDAPLVEGTKTASGSLLRLVRLGATIVSAPDYFAEISHLKERVRQAEIVVTFESMHGMMHPHNRIYTVSEQELQDPELLYHIFERKFAAL